ncbi:hypothetical protein [Haliangium sp.]|uniref:hypothetical protein n=1 Tax=Haliangium sp. TaxID=2663208 RepID=UPI003D0CDAA4
MASTTTWQRPVGLRPAGSASGRPPADGWSPDDDWLTDEPAIFGVIVAELQRFKSRMKYRPLPALLLATLMTAGAVIQFARKPPEYTARVILRISEGALSDYRGSVLPQRELKEYIYSFALPDRLLLEEIIEKHELFQEEMELRGATMALDELRDGISIDVYHNFFHQSRDLDSTPRSLRMAINYTHVDAEFAYKMAVLLSDLVVAVESKKRLDEVRFASQNAHEVLAAAEAEYNQREEQISAAMTALADAELDGDGVAAAMARVEIASLAEAQLRVARELENLRAETSRIDFSRGLEERQMGLVFEYAGQVRPVAKPPPGPIMLSLLGLVCFCIFVPVCAIGIGTVDSRVQDLEDVRRLGMPVLGHIPAFEGDSVGSLRRRGALARRSFLALIGLRPSRRVRRSRPENRVA